MRGETLAEMRLSPVYFDVGGIHTFFSRGGLPKTLGSVTLVLPSSYSNHGAERQNEHHGLMGEPSFGRSGATLMFMIITRCWSSQSKAARRKLERAQACQHKGPSPYVWRWQLPLRRRPHDLAENFFAWGDIPRQWQSSAWETGTRRNSPNTARASARQSNST